MENQIINYLYMETRRKALRYSAFLLLGLIIFIPVDRTTSYIMDIETDFFKRLSIYTFFIIPLLFYSIFYLRSLNKFNVIKFMYTTEYKEDVINKIEQNYASGNYSYTCEQDLNDNEPSVFVIENYLVYYTRFSPTFNKIFIVPIKNIKQLRYEKTIHERLKSRYTIRKRTVYNLHIDTDTWGLDAIPYLFISIFVKENMDGLIKCLEDNYGLTITDF